VSVPKRPGGKHGARPKTGPAKPYTGDELAKFAEFRDQRAPFAPSECNQGPLCWVAAGPPAISSQSKCCLGCGGAPKPFDQRRLTRKYPVHFR
jgi:hypothetical protein